MSTPSAPKPTSTPASRPRPPAANASNPVKPNPSVPAEQPASSAQYAQSPSLTPLSPSRRQNSLETPSQAPTQASISSNASTESSMIAVQIPTPGKPLRPTPTPVNVNDPSALAKAKLDQDDFIQKMILPKLDWTDNYGEPAFSQFMFFSTQQLPSTVARTKPSQGYRIGPDAKQISGLVYQISDQATEEKLEDYAAQAGDTIACDIVFIGKGKYPAKYLKAKHTNQTASTWAPPVQAQPTKPVSSSQAYAKSPRSSQPQTNAAATAPPARGPKPSAPTKR